MKERPILFSAPMVRALLDGSKTQTRRAVKDFALELLAPDGFTPEYVALPENGNSPYGYTGDRLWVRETFMDLTGTGVEHRNSDGVRQRFAYAAEFPSGSYGDEARKSYKLKWKPSIHMPRAASRILLDVMSVRVERLDRISTADARAEGLHRYPYDWRDSEFPLDDVAYEPFKGFGTRYSCASQAYRALWESINGAGSWAANPWVWVVEFKRVAP